jgi:glycine C-acetyltransferase
MKALDEYGAGTASVRFICGTFAPHAALEEALAALHRTESALTYTSCWMANTGLFATFCGEGDAIISDELNHASLIDGIRICRKSRRLVYRHSDMADLKRALTESADAERRWIVTDGVFSMEGDLARLDEIVALAERHDALTVVDDSHGVGAVGRNGRGTAEFYGVEGKIDVVTDTLGKALGGTAGGYVASSKALTDMLVQRSRTSLFSNALPITVAEGARRAIEILIAEPERAGRVGELRGMFVDGLRTIGYKPLESNSGIVPIIIGETAAAIRASEELLGEGVFVIGFGYPVVPEGTARLRIQVSAALSDEDVTFALSAFERVGRRLALI